jgi:FemAB-related protein (PEP-CTERM system-associated)
MIDPTEEYVAVEPAPPGCDSEWDEFVIASGAASQCHLSGWRRIIGEVLGHEVPYLRAMNSRAEIVGVLPLVRQQSLLLGDHLISVPFLNYGGAVGNDEAIERALMNKATELARNFGSSHIEFRDTTDRAGDWPKRTDKVCMVLELPDSQEVLWENLGSKLRSQIRRPKKEGVEVVEGGMELLDEFYAVLLRNWRDLGTPLYSKRFFQGILREFSDSAFILVARLDGQPVAAGFFLGFRDKLEIPWAGSLREFNRIAVNMALYWNGLRRAIEKGYRWFDFGRSSTDSGTYRFKRQWGAEPVQLYWHYWLREGGELPSITPSNPKYRLAINMWQRLPVPVAGSLGPVIAKYLP